MDELFNNPLDGKRFSTLNTYADALGLIEEQIMQVENSINFELANAGETETKLVTTENKINIKFSDDKNNIEKEFKIINVQTESALSKIKTAVKNGTMQIKAWGHSNTERTKTLSLKFEAVWKALVEK